MNDYLSAVLPQLRARVQYLMGLIPRDLPRDVHTLVTICRSHLNSVGDALDVLCSDPEMLRPENQMTRLRRMKRVVSELDLLETVPIAALNRWNDEDDHLHRLVGEIAQEIRYPLPTPVVAGQSQQYYAAYPAFSLIVVPLAESRFLLHLPDLYHELGHPLLVSDNDPTLEPFQRAWMTAYTAMLAYLNDQMAIEHGRRGPAAYTQYIETWRNNWTSWMTELFCDLHAVYTLGPAFVWAHFHLTVTRGNGDPFRLPLFGRTEHPPDAARMAVMLAALRRVGFDAEAAAIGQKWTELLAASSFAAQPEYDRCFPGSLLDTIVSSAYNGVSGIRSAIVSRTALPPVAAMLNQAWEKLWQAPHRYVEWEASAVQTYRARISSAPSSGTSLAAHHRSHRA
jgi:hypothetical protein